MGLTPGYNNLSPVRDSDGELSGLLDSVTGIVYDIIDYPVWPIQRACAADATTTVNGSNSGIGDVIGKLDVVVNATGATATLTVQDGAGTTYTLNPTGGYGSAGNIEIPLGYTAINGAWKVACGAGLTATASLL